MHTIGEYTFYVLKQPNQRRTGRYESTDFVCGCACKHTYTYKLWIKISLLLLYWTLALNCAITNYFSFIPSYTVILHSLCAHRLFLNHFSLFSLFFGVRLLPSFFFDSPFLLLLNIQSSTVLPIFTLNFLHFHIILALLLIP